MKMATKSYKIIILLTAFILSIAFAFGFMNTNKVYAASEKLTVSGSLEDLKNYFDYNKSFVERGINSEGVHFVVNKANSIDEDSSNHIGFKNDLIVNELDIKMKLPYFPNDNSSSETPSPFVSETSFRIDVASRYVNGNPKEDSKADTEYDTTIENIINLSYSSDENTVACKLNDVVVGDLSLDADGYFTLQVRVKTYTDDVEDKNGIKYVRSYLTIGDFDIKGNYTADQKIYYQIKNVDNRAIATDIEFNFKTQDERKGDFILASVDQMAVSDTTGAYKQVLGSDTTRIPLAKPRIYLNDSFYLKNPDGSYSNTKIAYNKTYVLNIKECSLLGGYGTLYLMKTDYEDVLLESNTKYPNEIRFTKAGLNAKFAVGALESNQEVVYEEFTVGEVKPFDYLESTNNKAPIYTYDEVAYKSFENALKNATVIKENGKETSIAIGTEVEIPSMKDLVSDDITPYEDLSTSISYSTRTTRSTASAMKFKVNDIGLYEFLVRFGDGKNTMEAEDFYLVDDKDENTITYGDYEKYIFKFEIKDNADIVVKAPALQGDGYVGVKYTASRFNITADGKTLKYELFYNPKKNVSDADAEGWVAIPQASLINDTNYNKDGFDYDEVKEIGYNGKLIFTPTRTGSYMIKCTASSTTSPRTASADTFISVNSKPAVVEVPSEWLANNVWSVVFLGIGSLCLIGIVILLCIKPKDQVDND